MMGTMIELPRAALRAGEIARNGGVLLLRHQRSDPDDTRRQPRRCRIVPHRVSCASGLIARDPFVTIDQDGVGELVRIAATRGRETRQKLKIRYLRRAWRRPRFDPILSRRRDSIMCPVRRSVCRLHDLPRRRRHSQ